MDRPVMLNVLTCITHVVIAIALIGNAPPVCGQEAEPSERETMYSRYLEFPSFVKGGSIEANWMADGSSFWYAEGAPESTVIWRVEPGTNTKEPMFDLMRLRSGLAKALGHEPPYRGVPFTTFTFADPDEEVIQFNLDGRGFNLELQNYGVTPNPHLIEKVESQFSPEVYESRTGTGWWDLTETLSPDAEWFVSIRKHNLWLRSVDNGQRVQITTDGIENYAWDVRGIQDYWWSPDNSKLAAKKIDFREVSEENLPMARLLEIAGGFRMLTELFIVDTHSRRSVRVDLGEPEYWIIRIQGWYQSELLFLRMNRDFNRLDLMAADPVTGATRLILSETQETFVIGWDWEFERNPFHLLENGQKFIWESERDGWNHLYLYDLKGNLIQRLTTGSFPVERVITIDEKRGWVYFTAHGNSRYPYQSQLYRVNLNGEDFALLTEATGQHEFGFYGNASQKIQFSPSKEYYLVTPSTRAEAPVVELRRADGTLQQVLSRANIEALKELKWSPPEDFVVKAADGQTDLHGVLYKPYDFDPNKKYPVIEDVYGGPHISYMELMSTFVPQWPFPIQSQALAQLGFIVCVMDARGTPGRGKHFQDAVFNYMGRYEVADHVAALKQLAGERPYMDLDRVGIYGHSFGGYMTIRAILEAPEFYDVGISSEPFVELEWFPAYAPYIGWPEENKEVYEHLSNLDLAGNLKGKLFLIYGFGEDEVMKMIRALIQANKVFDLLVLPDSGHAFDGPEGKYAQEAIRRYFQKHLNP